jgi:hypothetical protein
MLACVPLYYVVIVCVCVRVRVCPLCLEWLAGSCGLFFHRKIKKRKSRDFFFLRRGRGDALHEGKKKRERRP